MDCQDYITDKAERKKRQHLGAEERGAIKVLVKQGLGIRAVARAIGCAPSTVTNDHNHQGYDLLKDKQEQISSHR